jgi:hypothetical protein
MKSADAIEEKNQRKIQGSEFETYRKIQPDGGH